MGFLLHCKSKAKFIVNYKKGTNVLEKNLKYFSCNTFLIILKYKIFKIIYFALLKYKFKMVQPLPQSNSELA